MSQKTINFYDVVEKLSIERQTVIFRLALDMLSAQQTEAFDYYSPVDIQEIKRAGDEIKRGDCVSFSSVEKLSERFCV
ncbi:MAG: hypothetical protein FWH14_07765 [Oscillospiraceae bacterium]|nr:hypothetical protein [Oscillospiraceae bacterium]